MHPELAEGSLRLLRLQFNLPIFSGQGLTHEKGNFRQARIIYCSTLWRTSLNQNRQGQKLL